MRLTGVGASEGVTEGPAFAHAAEGPHPEQERISRDAVGEELERFRRADNAGAARLSETAERLRGAKKVVSGL